MRCKTKQGALAPASLGRKTGQLPGISRTSASDFSDARHFALGRDERNDRHESPQGGANKIRLIVAHASFASPLFCKGERRLFGRGVITTKARDICEKDDAPKRFASWSAG